jgi:putative membrane-bound dehydrogenase-like protein
LLAADANRLTYLDSADPFYVSRDFPKLTTPRWVGEPGVEAVVILAIDDMKGHEKWEAYLRPILERLKKIDGRAPVSIMTTKIQPDEPHLQRWLKEGVSIETHTVEHPCPLLAGGDLAKAKSSYDRCVDEMANIPRSRPVAFRTPCCDSLNTVSPRFFAEIFNRKTPGGNFLAIDSSVFQFFTPNDPALPRELVYGADGRDRFQKYAPADRAFVNRVDDYPYPYVIGRLCWEFPCIAPSDWSAQHAQGEAKPQTLADMQAGVDAAVAKQGVFTMVFHPYTWIRNDQIVALIDHAIAKHGRKVKFLNFPEALARLEKNVLGGQALRAADGGDNGARLLDLNGDGYLDAVIGNGAARQTRIWNPQTSEWTVGPFPTQLVVADEKKLPIEAGARFGVVRDAGPSVWIANEQVRGAWTFDGRSWNEDKALLDGLALGETPLRSAVNGQDRGLRLRDLDRDGVCELIVSNDKQQAIFGFDREKNAWKQLDVKLPAGAQIVDAQGRDAGLRFVDVDEDGYDDVVYSNERDYSLDLFRSLTAGWSRRVMADKAGKPGALPPITRDGTNNGAWFANRAMWVQNENTDKLKDLVDRRTFAELLKEVEPEGKSPLAGLRSIRARPGMQVELMVSEPLVVDPVGFDWGPDGRMWVVEMNDYPLGMDGQGKPGGRVKFLEDANGDGLYDRATVFLENLPFPSSVAVWRKGIIVTAAPDILYAEDTDGDGRADVKQVLFRGFHEGNQQHRVNGLRHGLDNWLYCANGDSGGQIESAKTGERIAINFRDFRIEPDRGLLDPEIGQSQFLRERDDWGNWFGNSNSEPMWQFVLEDRYVRRNKNISAPNPRRDVSNAPGAAPVFPISRTLPRFNDFNVVDRFTSACSAIVFRDELLGRGFAGNSFVSEPVHNLVHREVMTRDGVLFNSRRAADEQQSEFLASSDNWFRPTTLRTGPDGGLWIADMYRAVIEHPEYIPKDWQERLNLRAGDDKGRIYRVLPVGVKPRAVPRLDKLDAAGLVAALDTPNGWQRDMAQQMLVWRNDRAAVPLLKKMAADSPRALARLQALCALDGLQALDEAALLRGLADGKPGVRRHAIRLSESRLAQSPKLAAASLALVKDADAQVRMQLAYSLGEWPSAKAGEALAAIALADAKSPYITAAVMSSASPKHLDGMIDAMLAATAGKDPPVELLQKLLSLATTYDNDRALVRLLAALAKPNAEGAFADWQVTALAGLLDTLDRKNLSLAKFEKEADADLKQGLARVNPMFDWARKAVVNEKGEEAERLAAVTLLGRGVDRQKEDLALLAELLSPRSSGALQGATVAALARLDEPEAATLLLGAWKGLGPELRGSVLEALLRREAWVKRLLDEIEAERLSAGEIDAARRQRLLDHREEEIRARAAKLLTASTAADRQAAIDQYRAALATKGDSERGKAVFKKTCAACHRLEDIGSPVGPDLAALTDKSNEALLVAILDPNRAVESKFINYSAASNDGLVYTGVLAAETGASVTLVGQEGKQATILRADLEQLTSTGKSLMPEGLEKDVSPKDFSDLVAYLATTRPPRRVFAGNEPKTVEPEGFRGEFWLLASESEIYGATLAYEPTYRNLGMWGSESDHAVWTFNVTQKTKYIVRLDYACAADVAGNSYQLIVGDNTLGGKVASTGNWDSYRQATVGVITLKPGKQQVVLRPTGKLNGYLMDLKSVRITPVATD